MGVDVIPKRSPEALRNFSRALLRDVQALELMLEQGRIESGIRRFGAEQEFFLVDEAWRPAPLSVEILNDLDDEPFTTELARFNLEANLSPRVLEGSCFSDMHTELDSHVTRVRDAAQRHGANVVLTGILPTLTKSDLSLDNITPRARYHALNEAIMAGRSRFRLRIRGTDELMIEHDSVMLEACNTSAQVHLQVSAEEFAHMYNVAQAVTGPVLAAAVNSPLLFGRRLWAETRIALFQQSLDTRAGDLHMREMSPRVRFGGHWLRHSVTELFQEDIATFRALLAVDAEDSLEALRRGDVPKLEALQLFNGTVYRWNRPCYGISNGEPHLRIECRVLPAGPSTLDEMANTVFWIGAVLGVAKRVPELTDRMEFDDAKANFMAGSRLGLGAGMTWLDDKQTVPAPRLILETLLPLAEDGLSDYPVYKSEIERYLGVLEERVKAGVTGTSWALGSLRNLKNAGTRGEQLAALTAATVRQQTAGLPVVQWDSAEMVEAGGWKHNYMRVEQYMTTSLTTIHEDEVVELAAYLMHVREIRHILIEDAEHRLVGVLSYRSILKLMAEGRTMAEAETMPVSEVMQRCPISVAPETPTLVAISTMRSNRVSALPVVKDGQLVGLVSETDFMPMAYQLLEERLAGDE